MSPTPLRTGAHLLVALVLLSVSAPAGRAAMDAVPSEVIVKYRNGASMARRARALRALPGARILSTLDLIGAERVSCGGLTTGEAIARLASDPAVEYVQPNHYITVDALPNDPLLPQLWNLRNTGQGGAFVGDDIDAVRAWDLFTGDPALKIAVLDSGVDYTHGDLAANIWTNPGEIADNLIDDDGNGYVDDIHGYDVLNMDGDPMDDYFHGTHVAGIIGAAGNDGAGIVGVNWRCAIVAIKFIGPTGIGNEADAIAGLQYAIRSGARVVNNSWGNMSGGQAMLDAINACGAAGQLLVFSAGNNGWVLDSVPVYPPCYMAPNMINVTATDGRDLRPTWANYGATVVHLGAPGAAVYSAKPGGLYGALNGTSMAAPHVTGTLALAMGRYPHASAARIRQLLLDNTEPVASMAGRTLTGGRLNAYFVLANGDSIPPAAITDPSAGPVDSTSASLHWTAPGDDGLAGTASGYECRYSTAPIDASNFASALPVVTPIPSPAGTPESTLLTALVPGTPYWAAVRAVDDFGNSGAIVVVTTFTTTVPGTGVGTFACGCDRLQLTSGNPARVHADFRLTLAAATPVSVRVLDLSGRVVTELARGNYEPGEHGLTWNGRIATGAAAGAGVYFLQVSTARGTLVRRFALLD